MSLGNTFIGYGGTMKRAVVSIGKTSSFFTFSCNGKTYGSEDTFTATVGDVLTVEFSTGSSYVNGYLYVNGTFVSSGINGNSMTYNYTIQNSVDITFKTSSSGYYSYYYCYITDNTSVQGGYERSITEGKCLVGYDGTPIKAIVNITGEYPDLVSSVYSSAGYVSYNGNTYYPIERDTTTISVNVGDTIQVVLPPFFSSGYWTGYIYYNGEQVGYKAYNQYTGSTLSYNIVVSQNLDIAFKRPKNNSSIYAYITNNKTSTAPVYKIEGGRTLINNVAYFIGKQVVIVDMSTASYTGAYCEIDGTIYNSSNVATGLKIKSGDIVTFHAHGASGSYGTYNGYVNIDGTTVATTSGYGDVSYEWTVPTGITSIKIQFIYSGGTSQGSVIVTTS